MLYVSCQAVATFGPEWIAGQLENGQQKIWKISTAGQYF